MTFCTLQSILARRWCEALPDTEVHESKNEYHSKNMWCEALSFGGVLGQLFTRLSKLSIVIHAKTIFYLNLKMFLLDRNDRRTCEMRCELGEF